MNIPTNNLYQPDYGPKHRVELTNQPHRVVDLTVGRRTSRPLSQSRGYVFVFLVDLLSDLGSGRCSCLCFSFFCCSSGITIPKGDRAESKRMPFEKKIEFLESLTGKEEALDLSTTWKRSRARIKVLLQKNLVHMAVMLEKTMALLLMSPG
ncbi:hypothetical protein K1719_031270 [Acacia pycnantha]|nr:hypothetical protein K1719_031270 [Acacia pycnantha]